MEITEEVRSSLQELINTGIGRAATAFSEMLGMEIEITIPDVQLFSFNELKQHLLQGPPQEYVRVVLPFIGGLNGTGGLFFPLISGKTLIGNLIEGGASPNKQYDRTEQEVIAEVGNLIINAISATIGDMIGVEIECQLPEVSFSSDPFFLSNEPMHHNYCFGEGQLLVKNIGTEGKILFIYSYHNIAPLLEKLIPDTEKVPTVLIVDDSFLIRQSIRRNFKQLNYRNINIVEATNGKEALQFIESRIPEILIIDLLMPEMGGEETLQQLQLQNKSMFTVVLSSNFQKPVQERIKAYGVHLFVEKPITTQKLSMIMQKYEGVKNFPDTE